MQVSGIGILPGSDWFFASPSNQAKRLFYYVMNVGHYICNDQYGIARDNYNSYLIMHIIKGSARIVSENITFTAHAGETILINCHKPHSYNALGDLEILWFHYDGMNAEAVFHELLDLYDNVILMKDSYEIINGVNKIYNIFLKGKKISEAVQSAYIARVLGEFFQNSGRIETDKYRAINKVIDHIEEHYEQELPVKDLAKISGFSEFYLSRLFKKQTGYTPHEYVIKTRISNAKIMLKSTSMSLREIAYQCGFSNESSFSSSFKQKTEMTPATFRNTNI